MSFVPDTFKDKWKATAVIVLLGIVIYLSAIFWAPALLDDADSVHAEAAREMAAKGNFITLYIDNIRYLEKAPFMYWLMALGFLICGTHEIIARLPVAISAIALMLVTASFARWAFGVKAGLYAGIIIGSCVGIYLFTRILIPDVMVALWLTTGLYCFVRALDKIDRSESPQTWLIGLYSSAALGVLTKGLIGMVFPGAIIAIFLLLRNNLRLIPKFRPFVGLLLFLIIAAPWHILAGLQNPNPNGHGFFWFYFVNEHLLRYLGKRYPVDYDKVPLLLFYLLHLVWLFPWTPFAFLHRTIGNWFGQQHSETRARDIVWLLFIWPILIIVFFSFSTRQEYYTLPAFPALAILIGRALAVAETSPDRRLTNSMQYIRLGLFILSIIVAIGIGFIIYLTRHIVPSSDISTMLTQNPDYYALSLGHIFDLTPQSFSALRVPLIGTGIVFLLGTGSAYFLGRQNQHTGANITLGVMMAIFFIFSQQAMWVFEPYLSSKELALTIKQTYQEGDKIIINGEYESGSSLNFYLQKPVLILNNRTANLEFGSKFPDAPQTFIDDNELVQYWKADKRIYLFTERDKLPGLQKLLTAQPINELATVGGKVIISNQK